MDSRPSTGVSNCGPFCGLLFSLDILLVCATAGSREEAWYCGTANHCTSYRAPGELVRIMNLPLAWRSCCNDRMFPFGANCQNPKFSGSNLPLYDCEVNSLVPCEPGLTTSVVLWALQSGTYLVRPPSRRRARQWSSALITTKSPQPRIRGHLLSILRPIASH